MTLPRAGAAPREDGGQAKCPERVLKEDGRCHKINFRGEERAVTPCKGDEVRLTSHEGRGGIILRSFLATKAFRGYLVNSVDGLDAK